MGLCHSYPGIAALIYVVLIIITALFITQTSPFMVIKKIAEALKRDIVFEMKKETVFVSRMLAIWKVLYIFADNIEIKNYGYIQ